MRKVFALTVFILASLTVFGQKPRPLIIKGQLANSPEKNLKIFFEQPDGSMLIDTIHLDKDGRFYLKTFKIKGPQRTSIQQNSTQINNIYVAPGYNLTITADAKDYYSILKSIKIKGVGAEINSYKLIYDSLLSAKNDTTRWYELNDEKLQAYAKSNRKLKDSVLRAVFNKKATHDPYSPSFGKMIRDDNMFNKKQTHDPYFAYFGKMIQYDNMFVELYFLVTHVNINNYDHEKSVAYVKNNFDNNILNNLCKDEYLISPDYRSWLIGNEYLNYMVKLDYQKDSTLKGHKNYKLEKAATMYTGKVKDYVLYRLIDGRVTFTKSIDELNSYKSDYKPYISAISNPLYQRSINKKFRDKQAELLRTGIGKQAPAFTLQSNDGRNYSLAGFKGKVVYLDLWASWCEPCRAETPHLKTLYNKYKNDDRIAFISVSVSDGMSNWKKALDQDKPDWIQLIDKDGMVGKAYVANLIPQFVIIDKQGNIINLNAPSPSSGKVLEDMLVGEMVK